MLKVFIHAGTLDTRCVGNQLAILDIAYAKRGYLADYIVAMSIKGQGEVAPDMVLAYPRWSASLWDLIARALTRVLYRNDQPPPAGPVDRRCAYATKLCVVVERATLDDQGMVLATGEIVQIEGKRVHYVVNLEEDILGRHSATFTYGKKSLQHSDLVLRALCWALYQRDTIGKRPALLVPPTMTNAASERRIEFDGRRAPSLAGEHIAGLPRSRCAGSVSRRETTLTYSLFELANQLHVSNHRQTNVTRRVRRSQLGSGAESHEGQDASRALDTEIFHTLV